MPKVKKTSQAHERKVVGDGGAQKPLNRILIVENSFRPKNSQYILKILHTMRASKIELKVVDEPEAISEIDTFLPDVVLIDVDSLRHHESLLIAQEIRGVRPDLVIIFVTDHKNPIFVKEGMIAALWSRAYWLNQPSQKPDLVLPAIFRAFNGKKQLNPMILESAISETSHLGLLSPQQHRVMQLMARGASNSKIASDCHLTVKAVERTISAASKLLGVTPTSPDINPRVKAANVYRSSMLFHDLLEDE